MTLDVLTEAEVEAILRSLPRVDELLARVPPKPCAVCGANIVLKRADALYCGGACRQRAWRFRQRFPNAVCEPHAR